MGNAIFPWLSTKLLDEYGWRGAMLITSGLVAHVCCVAALIVQPHIIKKKRKISLPPQEPALPQESVPSQITQKVKEEDPSSFTANPKNREEITSLKTTWRQFRTIFSNLYFILVCVVIGFLLFSSSVGFTHLIAYAESEGLSSDWANEIATMAGVGSFGKDQLVYAKGLIYI